MKVGDVITRRGFITQQKFVMGQSLAKLEKRLGFETGRFALGVHVAVLTDTQPLPGAADFELRGYSQVADHHHNPSTEARLVVNVVKNNAIRAWQRTGPNSLVKIIPIKDHDNGVSLDQQYPPGSGVSQWKLTNGLSFRVIDEIKNYPDGRWIG
jgi:hypothetical protein